METNSFLQLGFFGWVSGPGKQPFFYGKLDSILESFGKLQAKSVAGPGRSWEVLTGPDWSWRVLAGPGGSWRVLAGPGGSWLVLAGPSGSWRVLAIYDMHAYNISHPNLYPFGVVHWVPEQLNIKAVTGHASWLMVAAQKAVFGHTFSGICHRNKVNSTACSTSVTGLRGAQ